MTQNDKDLMRSALVKQAPKAPPGIFGFPQPRAVGFVLDAAAAGPRKKEKDSLSKKVVCDVLILRKGGSIIILQYFSTSCFKTIT